MAFQRALSLPGFKLPIWPIPVSLVVSISIHFPCVLVNRSLVSRGPMFRHPLAHKKLPSHPIVKLIKVNDIILLCWAWFYIFLYVCYVYIYIYDRYIHTYPKYIPMIPPLNSHLHAMKSPLKKSHLQGVLQLVAGIHIGT